MADSLRKLQALKHLLMEDAYYPQLMRRSPNLKQLLKDIAANAETEAKEAAAIKELKGHVKGKDEPRGSGGGGGGDGSDGSDGGGGDGGDDDDSCDDNGDEV